MVQVEGQCKTAIIEVTMTASYDLGGSVLDMSSANTVLAAAGASFERVDSVVLASIAAVYSYVPYYKRASAGAPATGTIVMMTGASQASSTTDFSSVTFGFEVKGK